MPQPDLSSALGDYLRMQNRWFTAIELADALDYPLPDTINALRDAVAAQRLVFEYHDGMMSYTYNPQLR